MNFVTKEYLIQTSDFNKKNFAEAAKNNNRAASYCRLRLGADCTVNKNRGMATVEEHICPVCGQKRDCFVAEKYFSADGQRRIIKAECMTCESVFLSYQELPDNSDII